MRRTKSTRMRRYNISETFGIILLLSLIASAIYSAIRLLSAPEAAPSYEPYMKVKSDYLLMLVQCALGIIVMFLPTVISRSFKIVLPNTVVVLYFIFLYCAIFLGEVFDFYYLIPHWDNMLHDFSGAMLGALGFVAVDILNRDRKVSGVSLSPFFVSVFAFSFALAVGALWEIYEFSFDTLLGLNMQKYTTAEGIALVGREALSDTMEDMIIDALAALLISILGGILNYKKQRSVKGETVKDMY